MRSFDRLSLPSLVALLACLLSASAGAAADEAYVIGAADVLEIQVWDNKDLNQAVFVRPDGMISLPLIGEIRQGQDGEGAQDALAEAYTKSVKGADVTVIVKEIKSRPVYFIGGFTKPGVEQLNRELTVLQAVSIAGGLLPTADGDNGFILRGDKRIPVDFTKLMQKGDIAQNVKLEVGDSIVVPVADSVYVHGEVKTPGAYKSQAT
jgi:polysaccharide export outer membrane protein